MADRRIKIGVPALDVLMDADNLDDWTEIQPLQPDLLNAEATFRKHKWGSPSDSPIRFQTFLAWTTMRRRNLIGTDVTFEVFEKTVGAVQSRDGEKPDDQDDDEVTGSPTRPDPESG